LPGVAASKSPPPSIRDLFDGARSADPPTSSSSTVARELNTFPEAAREFAAAQEGSLDYKVSGSAWKAFKDSTIISTLATLCSVAFGTLAAYSIVRFRTGGDNYPFQFLTVRMFPPIAVVVPMVAMFSILRLSDTYWGLILAYTAFTLPFSIWMIRTWSYSIAPFWWRCSAMAAFGL